MSKAKQFETKVKKDWLKIEGATIDRLYDPQGGYYGVKNISDFIAYKSPNIFYLECKTHKGASIPLTNITQYEDLIEKKKYPGVRAGVLIWLFEKEYGVIYLPITTVKKLKEDGEKSFGVRHFNSPKYPYIILPGEKKRVYWDIDFTPIFELGEEW